MRFLDPLLLAGLALAALPVILHLINRKRAVRRWFPALEFLLRSNKRLARRFKLKQLLLLLLRMLLLVLLPLAMARPYLLSASGATADERLPTALVVVLDDSFSMGYVAGDESSFERARRLVLERVTSLRPWDRVALVLARDPVEAPVDELIEDHGRVRDAVAALEQPSFFPTDVLGALERAAEIHATGELPVRRTLVVTDHTAAGWAARELSPELLAQLGELELVDLVGDRPRSNVALLGARFEPSTTGGEGDWDVTAVLRNFGALPRSDVRVDLRFDGELLGTTLVDLGPDEETGVTFVTELGPGDLHRVELTAVVDGPDVPADNRYFATLHQDRNVNVLLVNGDPRTVRYRDELFYLERALVTGPEDDSGIRLDIVGVDGLTTFEGYDVVVLANVDGLPRARVGELVQFVRAGGGLWFTVGSRVDPGRYNDVFGELLPKPLRSLRELCDPRDPDANLLATRIARLETAHPVFRVFDLPGGESIASVSVYSYMLLEPSPLGAAETLMSYGDGGPALVEREVGAGRVALLTTTIDRDWTDLPIRTAFVPLARRLVRHLARRGAAERELPAIVGQRLVLDVEAMRPDRVTIVDPSGARFALTPEPPEPGRVSFVPLLPGHYEVSLDIGGRTQPFDRLGFAANLNARESDLAPLDPGVTRAYEEALSADPSVAGAAVDVPERRISLWPPLLFLLLVALYVESGLSARRRFWVRLRERLARRRSPAAGAPLDG
jgi:hypothetical protein